MAIYVAGVTHDLKSNTLEAVWLQEVFDSNNVLTALNQYKRRNYDSTQKTDFLNDLNTVGTPRDRDWETPAT